MRPTRSTIPTTAKAISRRRITAIKIQAGIGIMSSFMLCTVYVILATN
jgi:hypothetical protein